MRRAGFVGLLGLLTSIALLTGASRAEDAPPAENTAGQASSGTPRRGAEPWVLTHGHGTSTTSKPHRGDIYLWGGRETCSVG